MTDRITLIEKTDLKELFLWKKKAPDGSWITLFQGRSLIKLPDGKKIRTPGDIFFKSEAAGRVWLNSDSETA